MQVFILPNCSESLELAMSVSPIQYKAFTEWDKLEIGVMAMGHNLVIVGLLTSVLGRHMKSSNQWGILSKGGEH